MKKGLMRYSRLWDWSTNNMEKENIKKISQMDSWIGEEEKTAINNHLDSSGWIGESKKTQEFEKMIAEYTGAKYVSVVSNGTVSLFMILSALGIGKDDEVIVPDFTFVASASSVILAGAKPVLVDIDPKNLCLDLEKVKKAITPKTKAIMLVDVNGRCPEMEKFVDFAKENSLFLIEDAAQALGSKYKGKHLGTFGIAGSFSFAITKIITTGQGGAIITDDEELYKKLLKIKNFGRIKPGTDQYVSVGYNFKFTDLQAIIGIEQMKKLVWRVQRKKEMYSLYEKLLKDVKEVEFIETDLEDVSPWFIDPLLPNTETKEKLISFLQTKGIETRIFHPAIHTQDPYKIDGENLKAAENISSRGLWLPSSSFLTDEEIIYICQSIKEFFK